MFRLTSSRLVRLFTCQRAGQRHQTGCRLNVFQRLFIAVVVIIFPSRSDPSFVSTCVSIPPAGSELYRSFLCCQHFDNKFSSAIQSMQPSEITRKTSGGTAFATRADFSAKSKSCNRNRVVSLDTDWTGWMITFTSRLSSEGRLLDTLPGQTHVNVFVKFPRPVIPRGAAATRGISISRACFVSRDPSGRCCSLRDDNFLVTCNRPPDPSID